MNEGLSTARFPTFYVDDSACDVAGKKYVILSALTFPDEQKAIADWLAKKQEFGLHPYDEVKWNDRASPLERRRAFVPLLNNSIGIIVLDDSTKQAAAVSVPRFGSTAMKSRWTGFVSGSTKTLLENSGA